MNLIDTEMNVDNSKPKCEHEYTELIARHDIVMSRYGSTHNLIIDYICAFYYYVLIAMVVISIGILLTSLSIYAFVDSFIANIVYLGIGIIAYITCMCRLSLYYKLVCAYPNIVTTLTKFEQRTKNVSIALSLVTNIHLKIIVSTLMCFVLISVYGYALYGLYVVFPMQYKELITDVNNLTYLERLEVITTIAEREKIKYEENKTIKMRIIKDTIVSQPK